MIQPGSTAWPLRRQKLSGRMKLAIAGIGIVLGLILFAVNEWLAIAVILLAIGIPVGAYLALDPSQRRRLKGIRNRQIGN